jgi:hypothetical protein
MTVPVLILVVLIVAFGAEVGWLAGADGRRSLVGTIEAWSVLPRSCAVVVSTSDAARSSRSKALSLACAPGSPFIGSPRRQSRGASPGW